MRKFSAFRSLLLTAAALTAGTMWGEDFTIGTCKYTVNDDGTSVSVGTANQNSTDPVVIPATVDNGGKTYKVTQIATKGFANSKTTSITVPSSITAIGNEGIAYCPNLTSITFEEGINVSKINNHTFKQDKLVTELEIPEGVETIGEWVFEHMDAMTTLTLPSTLQSIGDGALAWIASMKTLTVKAATPPTINGNPFRDYPFSACKLVVPQGTKSLYEAANYFKDFGTIEEADFGNIAPPTPTFPANGVTINGLLYKKNDDGSTVNVSVADKNASIEANIPSEIKYGDQTYKVTEIAAKGFEYSKITKLTLPSSITTINDGAFMNAKSFTSVFIPKSVKEIGREAFEWAESLQSITFEEGTALKTINNHTFKGCNKVKELSIPEGITSIGQWVFENMTAMSNMTLPSTLESIDYGALARCSAMMALTLKAATPPTAKDNTFDGFPVTTCTLYVPESGKSAYMSTSPWSNFATITTGEFVQFTQGDFSYAVKNSSEVAVTGVSSTFTSGAVPAKITYQGKEYKVVEIGGGSFAGTQITSLTLPEGIRAIGGTAFQNCSKLTSINFPEGLQSIGEKAFENSQLSVINLPNTVTSLGKQCFPSTTKELTLSTSLTEIPEQMCMRSSITAIAVPEGVATIYNEAFYSSQKAINISLPSTLKQVGHQTFYESTSVTTVVCAAANPPAVNSGQKDRLFSTETYNKAVLIVPVGSKSAYQAADAWSNFASIEEKEITTDKEFEVDGIRYALDTNTTCSVAGLVNDMASSIVIPPAVKYNEAFVTVAGIKDNALANHSFTSVEIAQTVEKIGANAFANVPLTKVKSYASEAPKCAENAFSNYVYNNATLYVGAQCREGYAAAQGWKNFKNIVEEVEVGNTFTLGNFTYTILEDECASIAMTEAGLNDASITKLEIPEEVEYGGITYTVTRIGDHAFLQLGCPKELPEGTNHVKDCVGTIDVVLPNTIEEIGKEAFMDAHIKSITLPNTLTTVGEGFLRSTKLTGTLTIPAGITELPKDALSWVRTLNKVVMPEGLTNIREHCFFYSSIKEFDIPSTLETIGNGAFTSVGQIEKITVADLESFLQIETGDYQSGPFASGGASTELIYNGKVVTEIDFGQYNMTSVNNVLAGYQGLKTLIFPDYFTKIGYEAFAGCTGIEEVYCMNEQPIASESYVAGAFPSNVYANATLYIPIGCTKAYKESNEWKRFADIVEMDFSGIDDASADAEAISVRNGEILNPCGLNVEVFDVTGRVLYSGKDSVIKLDNSGLVIVKFGGKAIKTAL
ncbi:MAG: leucine-rich repeat domain-containing protein [Lachnospiraceae bacterium]|nr:leucine-rich repeat domain-containing protein [Lachnospiraceae bacterium]